MATKKKVKKKAAAKRPTKKLTKKPVKKVAKKTKRKAPAKPLVTPPDRPRLLTEPAPDPLTRAILETTGAFPVVKAVPEEDYTLPEGWSKLWRSDRGIWENTCPHGVGHPSDESVKRTGDGVHGCDGCCAKLRDPAPPPEPTKPNPLAGLTPEEEEQLKACPSLAEYNVLARKIKAAHGDAYPPDWFPKVMMDGGYYSQIAAREGSTAPIMTIKDGDGAVLAELPPPKPPEPETKPEGA